jgi:hypothetical protein
MGHRLTHLFQRCWRRDNLSRDGLVLPRDARLS